MPKRSSRKIEDVNEAAFRVVAEATGDESTPPEPKPTPKRKNAAAVALGRKGGLKGGKVRAERLTPERRQQIARDAARKRWGEKE